MSRFPPKSPAYGQHHAAVCGGAAGHPGRRQSAGPRAPRPLNAARLEEMALAYVARFATSAGRLRTYLKRKLRERGWELAGEVEADADPQFALADGESRVAALIERFVAAGYVDDESYAKAKTGGLLRRGFGRRRINEALGAAGIDEALREAVMPGEGAQRQAALAFARKRRFGPFGADSAGRGPGDRGPDHQARRQKQMAAMLRAGHAMDAVRFLLGAVSVQEAEDWAAEAEDEAPGGAGW